MERLIKDDTDCLKVNKLSRDAEIFYRRLKLKTDDNGRFHGDEQVLRSLLFPRKVDIRTSWVTRWILECVQANLLRRYVDNDRQTVIEVFDAKQRKQKMVSRFASECPQPEFELPASSPLPAPPPKKKSAVLIKEEKRREEKREDMPAREMSETEESALSTGAIAHGAVEIPEEKTAVDQAHMRSVPRDFATLCYKDWIGNNGCNSKNVPKPWLTYVEGRWRYEAQDWRSGKHRGKTSAGTAPGTNAGVGPKQAEVFSYARHKDGGDCEYFAGGWWIRWNRLGWKSNGKQIDWQVRFSEDWAREKTNQARGAAV